MQKHVVFENSIKVTLRSNRVTLKAEKSAGLTGNSENWPENTVMEMAQAKYSTSAQQFTAFELASLTRWPGKSSG